MTLPSSERQPDDHAEALASFVDDLRTLGLEVGVDDAFKIGVVFRHAEGWSHGRRVRAMIALLGRSEEQRRRIEEVAPLLFPDAVWEPEERSKAPAYGPSPNRVQGVSRRPAPTSVQAGVSTALGKTPRPRWKTVSAWIAALVMVAAAGWLLYGYLWKAEKPPAVEPPQPSVTAPPVPSQELGGSGRGGTNPPPEPVATEPPSSLPPEGLPLPWQTADDLAVDCDVLPVPLPPFWPFFSAFALLALWHVFYSWQRASAGWLNERTEIGQRALKASTGRRSYQLRLADPAEPLDSEPLREAAFALAAPRTESTEARLDPHGTVEATARAAGRLVLHLTREKEQGTVLLLEDVRSPMERWPDHGQQLTRTLERQGARVVRRFFQGSPEQLSEHRDLRHPARLDEVLADLEPELILVVTSASWFDFAKEGERLRAVGSLRDALWLHPRPRELWDSGARWLASRVKIQPLGEPEHLVRGLLAVSTEALPLRWWPPVPVIRSAEAEVSVLRYSLGEAFHWLAAGALLAEHDALTARAWWALRAGFQSRGLLAVPLDLAERVWEPRWVHVGSSGVVTIEKEHREELVRLLSTEQPKLRDQVLEWLESWIQQDVDRLEATGERPEQPSLGWLLAKLALARARSESSKPATRALADRELGQLTHGGFGAWVNAAVPRTDTTGWRLRRLIPPAPLPWQRRLTAAAVAAQLALLPLLASSELRRWLFPTEPSIQFLTKRETPLLSPNYPLRLCDQYQSLREFTARIGETEARVIEGRDSKGAVVWEVAPDEEQLTATFLEGLRGDSTVALELIGREPGRVRVAAKALVALDDRLERFETELHRLDNRSPSSGSSFLLLNKAQTVDLQSQAGDWVIAIGPAAQKKTVELWGGLRRKDLNFATTSGSGMVDARWALAGFLTALPSNAGADRPEGNIMDLLAGLMGPQGVRLPTNVSALLATSGGPIDGTLGTGEALVLVLGTTGARGFGYARESAETADPQTRRASQVEGGRSIAATAFSTPPAQLFTLPHATRWTYYGGAFLRFDQLQEGDKVEVRGLPLGLNWLLVPSVGETSNSSRQSAGQGAGESAEIEVASSVSTRPYLRIFGTPDQAGRYPLSISVSGPAGERESSKLVLEVLESPSHEPDFMGTVGETFIAELNEVAPLYIGEAELPPGVSQTPDDSSLYGTPQQAGDWIVRVRTPRTPMGSRLPEYHIRIRPTGCNGKSKDYCGGQCVDTDTDPFHWGGCFKIHPDLTREAAVRSKSQPSWRDIANPFDLGTWKPPIETTAERLYYKWNANRNLVEIWAIGGEDPALDQQKARPAIRRRVRGAGPFIAVGEIASACTDQQEAFGLRTSQRAAFMWDSTTETWIKLRSQDWTSAYTFYSLEDLDLWLREILPGGKQCGRHLL